MNDKDKDPYENLGDEEIIEKLQAENAKLRKLIYKSIQGFMFARMVLREACFHAAADDITDYIDVVSSSLKELEI